MPRYDEMWMGECQTAELARLASDTRRLMGGTYVEIGTWQGWSAIPIARAIAPSTLHVVDHWRGDGASIPPELVARPNKDIFLANVAEAQMHQPNLSVQVWDMDWREWAEQWDARPIRFLHLDAAHTTAEVRDNILAVLPLMVPGGILAGDDWDWPDVEAGIRQALGASLEPEVRFNKLWWVVC